MPPGRAALLRKWVGASLAASCMGGPETVARQAVRSTLARPPAAPALDSEAAIRAHPRLIWPPPPGAPIRSTWKKHDRPPSLVRAPPAPLRGYRGSPAVLGDHRLHRPHRGG